MFKDTLIEIFHAFIGESTGYENNGVPRKAAAKIVNDSECQQTSNSNICIVGDSSASSCVVNSIAIVIF